MKKNLLLVAALLASAASVASAQRAPERISYRTYAYTCDGGKKVSVAYMTFGDVNYARVTYAGHQYALAEAVSGSGSRYASLAGPYTNGNVGHGLEWWEWKGKATLSSFNGTDTSNTTALLTNCKAR